MNYEVISTLREATGSYRTYSALIKLQPWFLSLPWKTCLRQNSSLGSCACSEGPALGQNTLMMMMMMMIFTSRGEGWLGFPDLWSGQKPWWNWYLTPVVNFGEVLKVAASQIHCPHLHAGAPGIYSDLLRSVQMLKREWGAERNGKLPHLSIPSKIAVWVPEFAVEDLPLSRTMALVPEFATKDLSLGRILWRWWETPYPKN